MEKFSIYEKMPKTNEKYIPHKNVDTLVANKICKATNIEINKSSLYTHETGIYIKSGKKIKFEVRFL